PVCGVCHKMFDGIGFALEEFDGIGKYRATYADGRPVDAHGTFATVSFNGEAELATALARDPRFLPCAAQKALSYALGRQLGDAGGPIVTDIVKSWQEQGTTLRALVKRVTLDDTSRPRRGEVGP